MARFSGQAFPGARRLLRAVKHQEAAMRHYATALARYKDLHEKGASKLALEVVLAKIQAALIALRQANFDLNEIPIPYNPSGRD